MPEDFHNSRTDRLKPCSGEDDLTHCYPQEQAVQEKTERTMAAEMMLGMAAETSRYSRQDWQERSHKIGAILWRMSSDRFSVLQGEFEKLSERLKQTFDLAERRSILIEAHQLIQEMDYLIRSEHFDFDRSEPGRGTAP